MDGRISNFLQVAGIRRYTVTNGDGKGSDVIDCDNGKIRFLVNVDKACDIMQLYYRGENVSFVSKNGFSKREIPFINRFEGGMLYTCGLDSVGGRDGYEIHGSFHNTPAEIKSSKCDNDGIEILATIKNTALFGKNLIVERRIFTEIGSDAVAVEDTLSNVGYRDEEYCLLYHINVGYPWLDEGGKIVADVIKCEPRTDWAKNNIEKAFDIESAYPCAEETCYFLTLKKPEITYENGKRKITVNYSGETLQHFVEWKSTASGDYALGLEPCTTELDDRFSYKLLKAGEKIKFFIKISLKK